ncbi:MAG: energy-coupling factor transporter transmembrane component T [Candidatus Caldarchaeum sp.]
MPQWFEYEPKGTILHRLNPLPRVTLYISLLMLVSFYYDPYYLAVLAAVITALFIIAKTPPKWLVIAVPAAAYRSIEYFILGVAQANPALFKVWPKEFVSQVLFEIPFPFIGNVKLIAGAALWVFGHVSHIILGAMVTLTLIYTTSMTDYVLLLRYLRFPYQVIYVVTVALKFVPDLFRTISIIAKAQRLRGWGSKTRNPIKAAREALPVILPLTRQIVYYVDVLNISSQIRGGGAKTARYHSTLIVKKFDIILTTMFIVILSVLVYLLFAYNMGIL